MDNNNEYNSVSHKIETKKLQETNNYFLLLTSVFCHNSLTMAQCQKHVYTRYKESKLNVKLFIRHLETIS